ncbi:flavodoxin family protein [Wansuia hejianensis]|uniref:flavodoxin family protein n=1 Tax=Wansuia hejianensis TaxID=2763667 RepID=UPI002FE6C6CE
MQIYSLMNLRKTPQIKGFLACQKTSRCAIHDDADPIVQKMLLADVIAFSTPIYFYEMCGQTKRGPLRKVLPLKKPID